MKEKDAVHVCSNLIVMEQWLLNLILCSDKLIQTEKTNRSHLFLYIFTFNMSQCLWSTDTIYIYIKCILKRKISYFGRQMLNKDIFIVYVWNIFSLEWGWGRGCWCTFMHRLCASHSTILSWIKRNNQK